MKTEETKERLLPYVREHRRRRAARGMLALLSVGTALCVFAALMLPGVSMAAAALSLTSDSPSAAAGEPVCVAVSAAAEQETVFLLAPQSEAVSLSSDIVFADGQAVIAAASGDPVTLHARTDAGRTEYWFCLEGGTAVELALPFVESGADGAVSAVLRAVSGTTPELAAAQLSDPAAGESLTMDWSGAAADTAQSALTVQSDGEAAADTATPIASFSALQAAVQAGGTQVLRLTAGFTADAALTVPAGTDLTIDLNGCCLTNANTSGALFGISGGSLTICDSAAAGETRAAAAGDTYGKAAAVTANADGSMTLSYDVMETTVTDSALGTTSETQVKHTVTAAGCIKNGDYGSLFSVSDGTLSVQSGMLCGGSYAAIAQSGGTVNLSGGYLCGVGNTYGANGGAVSMTGGTLNVSGSAVLAGNSASQYGGAIYAGSTDTAIHISGDAVISGNTAGSDSGGIYAKGTVSLSERAYLTNNVTNSVNLYSGGGGLFLAEDAARLTMSGGFVTGNAAPQSTGGGIGMEEHETDSGVTLSADITGGFISGNVAGLHEGGGLTVRGYDTCTLTGGHITNNRTLTESDWGGGGVFISENGTLSVSNVLITNNRSDSFGAGVSACSTGKVYLYVQDGAAVYNNTAGSANPENGAKNEGYEYTHDNTVFLSSGYQDVFCVHQSTVTGAMLGGGSANWSGSSASCDAPVDADKVVAGTQKVSAGRYDVLTANALMGLTANPTEADQAAARQTAKVYINGNGSTTHGGGIMSNGNLVLGTPADVLKPVRLSLNGTKTLRTPAGAELSQSGLHFAFTVRDADGNKIAAGVSADGAIAFDPIDFSQAGTYVYTLAEQADAAQKTVTFDAAQYRLTVTVAKDAAYTALYGETKLYLLDVTAVTVEKSTDGTTWTAVKTLGAQTAADQTVTLGAADSGIAFVNVRVAGTSVSVKKEWAAGTTPAASVTVQLLADGTASGEAVTISGSDGWFYCWKDLPKYRADGTTEIVYTVSETPMSGYSAAVAPGTPPTTAVTTTSYTWQPASAFEDGATYLLVGTGRGALANTGASALFWAADSSADAAGTAETSEWTATADGGYFRLTNKGTGQVLVMDQYRFSTCASDRIASGAYAGFVYNSETYLRTNCSGSDIYFGSNFGYAYADMSPQKFTLYRLTAAVTTAETPVSDLHYVVTNTAAAAYTLPETGGGGTRPFLLAGTALLFLSLAALAPPLVSRLHRKNPKYR